VVVVVAIVMVHLCVVTLLSASVLEGHRILALQCMAVTLL